MLHIKAQGQSLSWFWKSFLKMFTTCGRGHHLAHVTKPSCILHGLSMLPDKAKFVECSIISLALSFCMKRLTIGQLQNPAKFSAFHRSPSSSQAFISQLLGTSRVVGWLVVLGLTAL